MIEDLKQVRDALTDCRVAVKTGCIEHAIAFIEKAITTLDRLSAPASVFNILKVEDCECPECGKEHLNFRLCNSEPLNKQRWRITGVFCKNCYFGITTDSIKSDMTKEEAERFFFKYAGHLYQPNKSALSQDVNAELLEALKEAEWSKGGFCPLCGGSIHSSIGGEIFKKHKDECKIGKAIARAEQKGGV